MKEYVPDYYDNFKCIAGRCHHTCCKGWEISIDEESLKRFEKLPDIAAKIDYNDEPHFILDQNETCPFLKENGLCHMILKYGENVLCQTCTDHPRFRNFFTDITETGLGMVCEEVARIILSKKTPMKLILKSDDGNNSPLPDDEEYVLSIREELLSKITEEGPFARLREYLIFRHIADALYDDRLEERILFIDKAMEIIKEEYDKTDKSFESLIECVRCFSYDYEYDEEVKEKLINSLVF